MFNRKIKEYTNDFPKGFDESQKLRNKILKPIPTGQSENLQGYIARIKELKEENELLKHKINDNKWLDRQRFDLEKDKEKLLEILNNNIKIRANCRLGNIRIHHDFINKYYLLYDSLTNKCMKISEEKID